MMIYIHLLSRVNSKTKLVSRDATFNTSISHSKSIRFQDVHILSSEEVAIYFGNFTIQQHNYKQDSAIVYLAPNAETKFPVDVWMTTKKFKIIYRLELLAASIKSLQIAFGETFNYPIVIFHQGYKEKEKRFLFQTYKNIIFQEMEFKEPKECNATKIEEWRKKKKHSRTYGYMSMCRYWATLIFAHPVLSNFKNVMRLDDDSYFHNKLDVDVFTLLNQHAYVYSLTNHDPYFSSRNYAYLFPFLYKNKVFNVNNKNELFTKFEKHKWATKSLLSRELVFNELYPNTNFLITRLDFWRTKEVSEFSKTYGCAFFEFGWTDSTIHAIFLSLFFEPKDILVKSMPYSHNFHDTTGAFHLSHAPWMNHLNQLVKSTRFQP